MSIKVILADDHRMFREALSLTLSADPTIEVVADTGNALETFQALEKQTPDVLVLDIGLPDMNGIEAARKILEKHPNLHIVALSGYEDKVFIDQMLEAGAHGYVVKSAGADELIRAVKAVVANQIYLSPEASTRLVRHVDPDKQTAPPLSVLGRREIEVLTLLATGKSSLQIAEQLGIAAGTVEVHRRNIRHKLGISSMAELTRYAIREGLQSV